MPTKTQKKYVPGSLGKYFAMFVAPALIVYLVFSIVPFLFTIYYSFTDYTDMNPVNLHFTGLANYIKVLGSPLMRTAIKNSLIYAVVLTGAQVVLGLPLAVTHWMVSVPLWSASSPASWSWSSSNGWI